MEVPFEAVGKHDPRSAIFQQNARASPLLRLPLEILRQIYREVLGDRFIRLKCIPYQIVQEMDFMKAMRYWIDSKSPTTERPETFDPPDLWYQYVCNKGCPNSNENLVYFGTKMDSCVVERCMMYGRPLEASPWPHFEVADTPREEVYDREMHLGLLRVCRQIYNDANPILWGTNTFSFDSVPSYQRFFEGRSDFQKAALRTLHLVVDIYQRRTAWNPALSKPFVGSLKGLVDLQLSLTTVIEAKLYRKVKSRGLPLVDAFFEGLVRLSRLQQLKPENVSLAPEFCSNESEPWSQSEKEDYTKDLKDRLLIDSRHEATRSTFPAAQARGPRNRHEKQTGISVGEC
ncbi:MAG: hypothetical protein Q9195_004635 [Heterodermia aff. obscurata]